MDQHDDHNIDEEDEDDPIKLLDVKNRDNIWFESDENHMLRNVMKAEEIQELEDDSHNIDPFIFKPVTNNLPLSFYNNSRNLHLLQNCHNFTIPIENCDRYKKFVVNGDTSILSHNTKSTVDIGKGLVETVVNDFDSNVILKDGEIDEAENEKCNVAISGSKIILGSIKKDTSGSKSILPEKKSMVIDCKKNEGLVGIKVKEYVKNKESCKPGSRKNDGLVGKKVKEYVSKINNKQITKLEAKNINATIEFDRLNTDDSGTNGASVNKIDNSNVEDELDIIKLPDQTTISVNKTKNNGVLTMQEKKNNKSNRILIHQPNLDLNNYNNKIITELERHDSTYITPSSFTEISTRKETSISSKNINIKENKKRRIENLVDEIKYRHSINKSSEKTIATNLNKNEVYTKLKATFDEMNGFDKSVEATSNAIQSVGEKFKKIETKKQEDLNMNSNFIINKMDFNIKSNTEKFNIPPNSLINEGTTIHKAVETDNIHHSTNKNGERVFEPTISCPNSVVNTNKGKSLKSKYEIHTHNILMHIGREVDVVNINNSNKREVVNNEWKSRGDTYKICHKLGLPIQNQTVTKKTVTKFNQLRETTQININTNIHGKHGVYKENMDAIGNNVTNYQFTNSQSAVESFRSLAEIQTPVFASGIGLEIKNKPMDQKILITKNVDHDNKKLVAGFQNKKKGNKKLISENLQKISSNMHNQNFDNIYTNSNVTAPRPCRFNTEYNDCTLNTEHHHIEKRAAILKQRNELIRIQNKEMQNRAVGNSDATDNLIPQNTNSPDNYATYSLMRNSLLNYNAKIQNGLDLRLNAQRQSYYINAAKNEIPRKVNAMKNCIPNCSRMCNRHANYNYNNNIRQLTKINNMNSTKRFYNQNSTNNVVPQLLSTHQPQYRNLPDRQPRGFNDNYWPVNIHPPLSSGGNFVNNPKIPMTRTQCNNIIQQNYNSQYYPMPNLLPYDLHSSISYRNGYDMPLNLSTSQLSDTSLQSPHLIDYLKHSIKTSPSVSPLIQSPPSTLVLPLVKERVQTSVQPPVFPSKTIPIVSQVHSQLPVPASKLQVLSPVPATVNSSVTIPAPEPTTALETASVPTIKPILTPVVATLPKPAQLPEQSLLQSLQHLLPQLIVTPISSSTPVTASVPAAEPMSESVPVPALVQAPVPSVQPLKETQIRPHLITPVASSVSTSLPPRAQHDHGHGEKVFTDALSDQKLEDNIERKHKLEEALEKFHTSVQPPVVPSTTIPILSSVHAQPSLRAPKPQVVLSPVPATVHSSVTIPAPEPATALGIASAPTITPILTPVVATLPKPAELPEQSSLQSLQHLLPQLVETSISSSTPVTASVPAAEPMSGSVPVPALVQAPLPSVQPLKETQIRPHLIAPMASSVLTSLPPQVQHDYGHGEKVSTDTLSDQKLEDNIERKHKLEEDLEKIHTSVQPPVFPSKTIPILSSVHPQPSLLAPKPQVVLSPVPATVHSTVTIPAPEPATALGIASAPTIIPILTPVVATLPKPAQLPEQSSLQSLQHLLPQLVETSISSSTPVTASVPAAEPMSGSVPVPALVQAPLPSVEPLKETQIRPHLIAPMASSGSTSLPPRAQHDHGHGEKVSTDTLSDQKLEDNIERKHKLEEDLEKIHTSVQPPVFPSITIPMLSSVHAQPLLLAPKSQVVLSPVPATVHSSVTIPAPEPAKALGIAPAPTIKPILTHVVATLPKPSKLPEQSPLKSLQHLLPQLIGTSISSSTPVTASVPAAEPMSESVPVPALVQAPVLSVQPLKETQIRPHLIAPMASSGSTSLPPRAQHDHGHGEKVSTDTLSDQKLEDNIERKHKLEEDLEKIHTSVQPPVFPSITIPMLSSVHAQPLLLAPKSQVVLSPVPATVHSSVTIPAPEPAKALGIAPAPTIKPILTPVVATLPKPSKLPEQSPLKSLQHLLPQLIGTSISSSTPVTASVPAAEPMSGSVPVPALVQAPLPSVQPLKETQIRPHLIAPMASSVLTSLPPQVQHDYGHGEKVSTDTLSDQKLEDNIERKHKLEEDLEKIHTSVQPPVFPSKTIPILSSVHPQPSLLAPKPQVVLSPVPATVHSSVTIPAPEPATALGIASAPTITPILTPVVATLPKPAQLPEQSSLQSLQHLLPQLVETSISSSTPVTASVPAAEPMSGSVPVPALVQAPVLSVQPLKETQIRPHLIAPVASSVSTSLPPRAQHDHEHDEKVSTDTLSDQKSEDNIERKHKLEENLEKNGEVKKKRISFEEYKKRRALLQLENENDNSKGCKFQRISFEEYKKRKALLQLGYKNDKSEGCSEK